VTVVGGHAELPPAGFVDTKTDDGDWPTATHSVADGHETLAKGWVSMLAVCHALAPPVGLVEVTTFPALSTATHNEVPTHETAANAFAPSTEITFHAAAPPVGFVEVITSPDQSTATQSDAVGHDIPVMWIPAFPTRASVHAPQPPVGSVDVAT
jgi:hypothetical protein